MEIERLFWKLRLTCVLDRVLEVGCGTGGFVRRLLEEGADAFGVDHAAAALHVAEQHLPGRTRLSAEAPLPFADEAFDTIVCRAAPPAHSPETIERFARDLRRVARRHAALCVPAGAPGREWWDARFLAVGWRRHPALLRVVDYGTLDVESGPALLLYEKIPDAAFDIYPLRDLAAERDLHMDMLREPGRRSDAHLQRYAYAATLVRPNDVVLDIACGLGYGLAVMAATGRSEKLIGIDNSAGAVEYARTMYGGAAQRIECRRGDAHDLGTIPDGSVHLVVSFETLEHVARPDLFLREVARVLAPGGRFVGSIPNEWLDETGHDPNPHHLHVFDAERLLASFTAPFMVETLVSQTAGGGMKSTGPKGRSWQRVAPAAAADEIAEWWIAVARKDPPTDAERVSDSPVDGSVERGAALRAFGDELLNGDATHDKVLAHLRSVETWLSSAVQTPDHLQWRISLEYQAGRLALTTGLRVEALQWFERCAARDATRFSPLLSTKTVDAAWMAGQIHACDRNHDAARRSWLAGLEHARVACAAGWREAAGDTERPLVSGLREPGDMLDLAARCAAGLSGLDTQELAPGRMTELRIGHCRADSDRITGREVAAASTPRAPLRRVGVFGSGSGALRVWEALAGRDCARVVWFADNDVSRQGTTVLGLDVIAPSDVHARGFDAIVIGSQSRAVIHGQLQSLGVERFRILAPDLDQRVEAIRADVVSALAALDSAFVHERC